MRYEQVFLRRKKEAILLIQKSGLMSIIRDLLQSRLTHVCIPSSASVKYDGIKKFEI